MSKPRERKCRECGGRFRPMNTLQSVCGMGCAIAAADKSRGQKERAAERKAAAEARKKKADGRRRLEQMKTVGELTKEAQAAFNSWVRERDFGLPCISCGRDLRHGQVGGQVDAGHYRSVGSAPEIRFEPDNCHAQCVQCNRHLSGNSFEYRKGLYDRIGPGRLAAVESSHPPARLRADDLRGIRDKYRALARELKRERLSNG